MSGYKLKKKNNKKYYKSTSKLRSPLLRFGRKQNVFLTGNLLLDVLDPWAYATDAITALPALNTPESGIRKISNISLEFIPMPTDCVFQGTEKTLYSAVKATLLYVPSGTELNALVFNLGPALPGQNYHPLYLPPQNLLGDTDAPCGCKASFSSSLSKYFNPGDEFVIYFQSLEHGQTGGDHIQVKLTYLLRFTVSF